MMSWRLLGRNNYREHLTIYLLGTASNLLISIPLYIATRASAVALLPLQGSTGRFISAYGISWGVTVDFLWTLFVFQGLLSVLAVALAGASIVEKGWRGFYVFAALIISGFVGYWLGARFLQTLSLVSLLQNSGIDSSTVYADLFWYGLGATIFFLSMMLVLRRSYNKLSELRGHETAFVELAANH